MKQFEPINKTMLINSKIKAWEIIDDFFYTFHAVEAKEEIRNILNRVLQKMNTDTGSDGPNSVPEENIIYFCEKLEELVEAASFLRENN